MQKTPGPVKRAERSLAELGLDRFPRILSGLHSYGARVRIGFHLGVVTLLVAWYLAGVLIAWSCGALLSYVEFYPGVVMFVGIGLVAIAAEEGRSRYCVMLRDWVALFEERLEPSVRAHWENLCDDRRALASAITLAGLSGSYVVLIRVFGGSVFPASSSVRDVVLGPFPLFVFVAVLGAAVGFAAGVALYYAWEHIRFIRAASSLAVDPYRFVSAKADLSGLSTLITTFVILWFVGIALCTVVLFQTVDWFSIAVYGSGVAAGVAIFCAPHWYIHKIIKNSKSRAKTALWDKIPIEEQTRPLQDLSHESLTILTLVRETDAINDWTIDLRHVITLAAGAVLPYVLTISPVLFASH